MSKPDDIASSKAGSTGSAADTNGRAGAPEAALLWDVVHSAGLGLFDLDLRRGRLSASARALEAMGLDSSDRVDLRALAAHADEASRPRLTEALSAAVEPQGNGALDVQYRSARPDGTTRWLGVRGRAHFSGEGARRTAVRLLGVVLDITERVDAQARLDEEHEWLTLAVEAGQMGIWEWNFTRGTRRWNDSMYRLYGVDRCKVTVLAPPYIQEIVPEDAARVQAEIVALRARGGSAQVEFRIRRADTGEIRWVTSRGVMWKGPSDPDERMLGVTYDITERKASEQRLLEADRRKDEFLAMLAHELRNPLAPIRNSFALLDREALTDRGQQALRFSQRQLRQLTRLVDDLLEVSRVTRGMIELRPEPVMVQHVVYAAAESVAASLQERSQRIVFQMPEQPVRLVADPARLAQIVENLLANASKYTDAGGEITVRVGTTDDSVTIDVQDTGIGIAPADLPQLFNLFFRVDTAIDRSRGGLGIGLALVKRLVELHAGTVSAHSEGLGHGSVFTVRLPFEVAASAIAPAVRRSPTAG
jgi:PAS domain S-box-containing protein